MLQEYIQPIYVAISIFAVIAVMIFVPWLFYIYRKYGFFPFSTTVVVFSFIFYFLAAFLLTMLPLPDTRHNCTGPGGRSAFSFVPFQFVADLLRESKVVWSSPSTYVLLLGERAFFQAFFNLLLLMPLGVYLRYYYGTRRAWWKALAIVAIVTLFYEITQATGIYGIYDCPYRLFDVDDLMLNTVGGMLGFLIAPVVLALFPSRARVREKAAELLANDEVRNMPILLAMVIDLALVFISGRMLAPVMGLSQVWNPFILNSALLVVFLLVIPSLTHGQTLGGKVMRFRYTGDRLIRKLTKRMLAVLIVYAVPWTSQIFNYIDAIWDASSHRFGVFLPLLDTAVIVLLAIVLVVHTCIVLWSKGTRRFFFDSVAQLTPTRKPRAQNNRPPRA